MGKVVEFLPPARGPRQDPFPALRDPVLHLDDGTLFVPHPFVEHARSRVPLCDGLMLGWAPCAPAPGVLLSIWGGHAGSPSDESVTATLSRCCLRRLIADLQSIERQMDDLHA